MRMRIISENIANAESTASSPGGDPYRRRVVMDFLKSIADRRQRNARAGRASPPPAAQQRATALATASTRWRSWCHCMRVRSMESIGRSGIAIVCPFSD
jgi:flagellar basal body rod protein FlgC